MDGSGRFSSSAFALGLVLGLAESLAIGIGLVLALGGCVDEQPGVEGTTSLRIELSAPSDTGDFDNRLDDSQRTVTFSIQALDAEGEPDPTLEGMVDVYVHFLGSLTPRLDGGMPLTQENLVAGRADDITLDLPQAFGPSFLWVEHTRGDNPTYATGTSRTLWYRNPHLEDISRPRDEMALDALEVSPLQDKQVEVTGSRFGASGRMVVTGVYAQGYTVSDVQCADANGTPPCVPGDYDHMFVFTFSRPEDEEGKGLRRGQIVSELRGSISEFNGLTEVNFPQTLLVSPDQVFDVLPEPVVLQPSWLSSRIEMERVEAALVAIDDAELCELDDDFITFKQWKLDIGLGCRDGINIITAGQVPDFDPTAYVGQVMPRVVGTLRPINIGSFHVWIVYPRELDDITVPAGN